MPAIPVMDECEAHGQHYGLTKREHFAGLAMQGMIGRDGNLSKSIAKECVEAADRLLLELEK